MSTQSDDPRVTQEEQEQEQQDQESALEELMDVSQAETSSAATTPAAAPPVQRRSAEPPTPAPASVEPSGSARRNQWALRALLAVNLAMMGIVLALPTSGGPQVPESGGHSTETAGVKEPEVDPFARPPRTLGAMPTHKYWDEAVQSAGRGDLTNAIRLLKRYLELSGDMTEVERRLVYNQLAFYLAKDGRTGEALEYERMSNQLMSRSHLPDDLLESAHRAEQDGQLAEMRSAYARFLLQQKQIPPSLRQHIAEAYLKLGDSYRREAEAGERKSKGSGARSDPAHGERPGHGTPGPAEQPGNGAIPTPGHGAEKGEGAAGKRKGGH